MKVLVVDDEALARQRLRRLLERVRPRAECLEADSGQMALEQVKRHEPDLVLLDIRMPGLDGIEVAARLEAFGDPPAVVFCTAYDEYALDALRHQAVAYLLKPVRELELARALDNAARVNRVQLANLRERASREELYHLVAAGSRSDTNFFLLVILSTVVATVGLEQDSITILIGAMVIAPLLGPNVAFSFGAAIGDQELMWDAVRTAVTGVVLSIVIAGLIALIIPPDLGSRELMARTSLDYAGIVLALASGAAAALSVTTGLSSTLVGVMVAVALLPPAATFGMMLASREWYLATGAAMLLAGNVACVNLSAQVVFVAKGIKPRLWQDRKHARRAMAISIATWLTLIVVLAALIAVRET